MTADNPSPFVPKLRFPEFRDGPRWDLLTLSSASDVNPSNDGLPESFIYIDLESVKSSMLIERKQITRDAAPSRAQRLLSRKDIIYQTVRPYQRNNFFFDINDGYEYVASTGYAQLRAHECPEFLYQLLHTESFVNSVLARCTGSNYPAINPSVLASIHVAQPRKPEQQKIADCLGSLDDLIAAEGRKLETLQQHKQGLMQQLFPQPGESVPILRFSGSDGEFEWQYKVLAEIATNLDSMRSPVAEGNRIPGEVPYYGASGVVDYVKDHIFDEDLLCVSEDGANLAARTYPIAFSISGRTWVNNHAHVLRFEKSVTQILAQAYLNHIDISDYLTGMAQPKLNRAMLDSIPIALPPTPHEENDVAGCIASLDHLLSMHHKKLESLSAHKQGLLQQLFPSPEGESR